MLDTRVILGPAGSGKSTLLRALTAPKGATDSVQTSEVAGGAADGTADDADEDLFGPPEPPADKWLLTATTGVAAFNLGEGCTTINSLLRFYDQASLEKNMAQGYAWAGKIYKETKPFVGISLDEISMMPAKTLDLITSIFIRLNEWRELDGLPPLKFILSGDFLQLPPITRDDYAPTPYPFKSQWWPSVYAPHTEVLRTIWRQDNPIFIQALTAARCGDGLTCSHLIQSLNATFYPEPWYGFNGFTIYPIKTSVEKHNVTRLKALPSQGFSLVSERWASRPQGMAEWEFWKLLGDLNEIPEAVGLKEGCRVRFTANSQPNGRYVNGQLATLKGLTEDGRPVVVTDPRKLPDGTIADAQEIIVPWHYRISYRPASEQDQEDLYPSIDKNKWWFEEYPRLLQEKILPFYNPFTDMVAQAVVRYFPLELGYAATFHKTQGLQFDNLQIDLRNRFAGRPQMVYVALSRLRTAQGLHIVGDPSLLARRIATDRELWPYI